MPTGYLLSRRKSSVTIYKAFGSNQSARPKGTLRTSPNCWRHSERFRLGLVELAKGKQMEDCDSNPSMWHVSCCRSPLGQSLSVPGLLLLSGPGSGAFGFCILYSLALGSMSLSRPELPAQPCLNPFCPRG